MGRKLKFGEKTKWVSVRVPESKAQIIRPLIREFVEILFLSSVKPKRILLEKFIEKLKNDDNIEIQIENEKIFSIKNF